jgi:hypothetical protein
MKFSIRDLFLVTVIAALAVAWWVDRSRLAIRQQIWEQRAETAKEVVEIWYGDKVGWGTEWPLRNYQAPAPNPPKD